MSSSSTSPTRGGRSFYVCGSPAMVSTTVRDLAQAGIPHDVLHFEDVQ
ncbi:hypothetical protein [Streptomyces sp. MK7]|nr:hypothetical protein [Streptomyces sp. MK7]